MVHLSNETRKAKIFLENKNEEGHLKNLVTLSVIKVDYKASRCCTGSHNRQNDHLNKISIHSLIQIYRDIY